MFYINIIQTEKIKFYRVVLISAAVFLLINISSSQSMQNGNDNDVVAGAGRLAARATFYTAMTKGGEWLGGGLAVNALSRVGNNTTFGTWLRGWTFLKNADNVRNFGRYTGAAVGFLAAEGCCNCVLPAVNSAAGSISRTIESIWEWDPKRSSTRDKIVTGVSLSFVGVSLYHRKQIANDAYTVLFGSTTVKK